MCDYKVQALQAIHLHDMKYNDLIKLKARMQIMFQYVSILGCSPVTSFWCDLKWSAGSSSWASSTYSTGHWGCSVPGVVFFRHVTQKQATIQKPYLWSGCRYVAGLDVNHSTVGLGRLGFSSASHQDYADDVLLGMLDPKVIGSVLEEFLGSKHVFPIVFKWLKSKMSCWRTDSLQYTRRFPTGPTQVLSIKAVKWFRWNDVKKPSSSDAWWWYGKWQLRGTKKKSQKYQHITQSMQLKLQVVAKCCKLMVVGCLFCFFFESLRTCCMFLFV